MNNSKVAKPIKTVGEWVFEEIIGKGAQATVYRGRNKSANKIAAIKEICLDQVDQAVLSTTEVDLIKSISHPFVIKLWDHFLFEKEYYIIYEYITQVYF
ncbi:uncharacterized protein [Blastocystis hominis]|uniref:Protein kinase domain-containing protein n=1 Tax=Blastocystis hominis TaxID=12968 RepID=D8M1B9_BLAHO|nr:uncharacterized protein [Blastocystis hominis]CBK21858.2 unnamed protein product [Blastocystis hominis]|eukprot:XP_012895906.1 uncharacterized protein [Blastocystis hominis]